MKLSAALCLGPVLLGSAFASWVPTIPSRHLEDRATTRDYAASVKYGKNILAMAKAKSDAAVAKIWKDVGGTGTLVSKYTSAADLETYGWSRNEGFVFSMSQLSLMETTLYEELKISESHDQAIEYKNNLQATIDGKTYIKTHAVYASLVNVPGGLIVADNSLSPGEAEPEDDSKLGAITPLKYWSDVAYLEWSELAGKDVKSLKYIMRSLITNAQTRSMIKEALKSAGLIKTPTFENARTFKMTEDAGLALLGSQNGAGCGFMLIGHKAQLGVKTITEVTVWGSNELDLSGDIIDQAAPLYMLFKLGDA